MVHANGVARGERTWAHFLFCLFFLFVLWPLGLPQEGEWLDPLRVASRQGARPDANSAHGVRCMAGGMAASLEVRCMATETAKACLVSLTVS